MEFNFVIVNFNIRNLYFEILNVEFKVNFVLKDCLINLFYVIFKYLFFVGSCCIYGKFIIGKDWVYYIFGFWK